MAALWNPEALLDIRGSPRFSSGIQCHGRNGGYRSRCGWTKGGRDDERADVRGAENLLRAMAVLPPSTITPETLSGLARLCLCRDHHVTAAQIDKLVRKWEVAVRQASTTYPSGLATPPATPPRLQSQISDSETLVSSQRNPFAVGFGSFSTKEVQQPHHGVPDAVVSRGSAVEKRLEGELAVAQKKLSASRAQEKELLDKMHRLEQLNAEHLRLGGQRDAQLAIAQTKVSTLEFENERSRQRERDEEIKAEKLAHDAEKNLAAVQLRLSALEIDNEGLREKEQTLLSEHSAWRSQTEEMLAAAQKKFSVLDIENKDLREKERHLVSEHSAWRGQMEEILVATQKEFSALDSENQDLRDNEQRLLAEHSAQTKQMEESSAAAQKKFSALEVENQDLRKKEQHLVSQHLAQRNQMEQLLAAAQKKSSALELEHRDLCESEQRLQSLASDLQLAMDRATDRAKSEMGAVQQTLAQVIAGNAEMKKVGEQKDRQLQALQAQLDALRDDNHQLNAHLQEQIAEVERTRAEMLGSRVLRLRAWLKTKGRSLRIG